MGRHEAIDPHSITPLHDVRNSVLLCDLVRSMRKTGWQGRALLVIERRDDFLAWTGSHRIAAARGAELPEVPCYVVDAGELRRVGADANWGHVENHERMAILAEIGDEEAVCLMSLEDRPLSEPFVEGR